ncbi:hypothetical protein KR093_008197, partial [Drosophila rubida]
CAKRVMLLKESQFRSFVTHHLNNLRHRVASGKFSRELPIAARMGIMSWHAELAFFARLDVSRCQVIPRPCMSSRNFYRVGHLAGKEKFPYSNSTHHVYNAIESIIKSWYEKIDSLTPYDTLQFTLLDKDSGVVTAALLLLENNTKFGCGVLRYADDLFNYVILSCAFNTFHVDGDRMYEWGQTPGAKCRRKHAKYTNLCDSNERYEYHKPIRNVARI